MKLLDGLIKADSGTVSYSFKPKTALVLHHTPMIKAFGAIGKQIGAAIQAQIDEDDDGRNEAIRGVGKASLKLLPFLGIPENSIEQLVKMAQARIDQIQSE